MNRKNLLVVLSLAATTLTGHANAQTRDENWAQCGIPRGGDPTIKACTAIIRSGVETTESLATIFHERGLAYISTARWRNGDDGLYDLAIKDFDEAIRYKPDSSYPYAGRASANYFKGQYARSILDYDRAIQLIPAPESGYYLVRRGLVYRDMGEYDRAIQDYNSAEIHGAGWMARIDRCTVNALAGRFSDALADCNKSIENLPDYTGAYDGLGLVYLMMRDAGKAITAYNTALAKSASNASALYGRGKAELMLNNPTAAKADMDAARRVDPRIDEIFAKVFKFLPTP
jgi:tetratricopeptide (TPR) repeat protein